MKEFFAFTMIGMNFLDRLMPDMSTPCDSRHGRIDETAQQVVDSHAAADHALANSAESSAGRVYERRVDAEKNQSNLHELLLPPKKPNISCKVRLLHLIWTPS